jgi:hypothetical protein
MEGDTISFVTWPDGRVDGRSLTVCGKRDAKKGFVDGFLPKEFFGTYSADYVADTLWRGCQDKGFKVHTILIKDGKPILEES